MPERTQAILPPGGRGILIKGPPEKTQVSRGTIAGQARGPYYTTTEPVDDVEKSGSHLLFVAVGRRQPV